MFKKVARGGVLFSVGTIGANTLQFVSGLLVIRLVSTHEYGFISLAYVLTNVLATVTSLGFMSGLPRFIAAQKNGLENPRVIAAISSAIVLGLCVGTILSILMYAGAPYLAHAFGKAGLVGVLKMFALMILPLATLNILSAVFRGMGNPKPKVWFFDLLMNASRLSLLWLVFAVGAGFESVLWAYVASAWVAVLMFGLYTAITLKIVLRPRFDPSVAKELVFFSLPLLGVALAVNVLGWGGTLVLGVFSSPDQVAFFSVPMRLVSLVCLPLVAMGYLYLPIVTDLLANGGQDKLREMYALSTKWTFLLALPLLLFFLLDTRFIVALLFGERYRDIDWILRILVTGYSFNTFIGPNGTTLMSAGNGNAVFVGALLSGVGSVMMSMLLVPQYGALGAAIGTALALLIANGYLSLRLYYKLGVNPFIYSYLAPVVATITLAIAAALMMSIESQANWIWHAVYFLLVIVFAAISPFLTMTMSQVDVELLAWVERRIFKRTRISDRLGLIVAGTQKIEGEQKE